MIIRDVEFFGPEPLGTELPDYAGIYLVCTESSGGIRIIGVYGAQDMRGDFPLNQFKDEWSRYEDNNGLFVYWSTDMGNIDVINPKVADIIYTRPYPVTCVKRLEDDW